MTTKTKAAKQSSSYTGKSLSTTDHDAIREWVEARGGKPASVKGTGDDIGILRIDFPGYSGADKLEPITWEQFFEKFEENNLEFFYQEETSDGKESRFSKFVTRTS